MERKTMMKTRLVILTSCLLSSCLLFGGIMTLRTAFAKSTTPAGETTREAEAKCSLATLNGKYVVNFNGFQIVGSKQVPFAIAGFETFDGRGHAQGVISQSVNGKITSHIPFTGTYTITPDCFVTETDIVAGTTLHFDEFTTPDGRKITFVETDPGVVASGVETRGTSQQNGN
jgi:hypothetical protein